MNPLWGFIVVPYVLSIDMNALTGKNTNRVFVDCLKQFTGRHAVMLFVGDGEM
jgi:hypothetical protein